MIYQDKILTPIVNEEEGVPEEGGPEETPEAEEETPEEGGEEVE